MCPAFDQTVTLHNTPGAPAGRVFSSLAQANEAAEVTDLPVGDPLDSSFAALSLLSPEEA